MKSTILSLLVFVLMIAFPLSINFAIYQNNKFNLNSYRGSRQIKPNKARYAFSCFVYCLFNVALFIPLIWTIFSYDVLFDLVWIIPLVLLAMLLILIPSAYPYYTIAIYDGKINGATLLGWMWRRAEFNLAEINKHKVLSQNLGKKLGITVIHSTSGIKILALGLDETQLAEILTSSSGNSQ